MTIKGISTITAGYLIASTLNFSTFETANQVASYFGLVPRQRQSGNVDSPRHIGHAGNRQLRQLMYLAAMTSVQHNPHIKRFYTRLVEKGKPKKVAMIACARKLVHIVFAIYKNGTEYDPEY